MTLPASGAITLENLRTEFSGPTPHSLTDYYRGGTYVPDTPANAGVPTSGAISLTDFYGATNVVYTAIGGTYINNDDGSGFQTVKFEFEYESDGEVRRISESGGSFVAAKIGNWSSAATSETGAGVHVRVSYVSGDAVYSSGAGLGTWLALTSDRNWVFQQSVDEFDSLTGVYNVELSLDGGSTVHDSATLNITLRNDGP